MPQLPACKATEQALAIEDVAAIPTWPRQPPTGNRQPPTANRQPPTDNRQPPTGNGQPATGNRQPATGHRLLHHALSGSATRASQRAGCQGEGTTCVA